MQRHWIEQNHTADMLGTAFLVLAIIAVIAALAYGGFLAIHDVTDAFAKALQGAQ
jgi:hypothetical protein